MSDISEKQFRGAILAIFLGLAFLIAWFDRSNLVDPIPLSFALLSAAIGGAIGAWTLYPFARDLPSEHRNRAKLTIAALFLFSLFTGPMLLRTAVDRVAFADSAIEKVDVEAKVTKRSRSTRWPHRYSANISPGEGTREIRVRIDRELYSELRPKGRPGRGCIAVKIETGKFGIRRIIAPSTSDDVWGISRYRPCD